MIGHCVVTSLLHFAHQFLQLHGFAHVALNFHFPRHEGSGGLQFACKKHNFEPFLMLNVSIAKAKTSKKLPANIF